MLAAAADVLAVTLPWARYGDTSFTPDHFPGWPIYVVAAVLLHGCVAVMLLSRSARRPAAALFTGLLAVGVAGFALWMASRYDESGLFFTSVVPMVMPMPGPGGAIAVVAALASGTVAAVIGLRGVRQGDHGPAAEAVRT